MTIDYKKKITSLLALDENPDMFRYTSPPLPLLGDLRDTYTHKEDKDGDGIDDTLKFANTITFDAIESYFEDNDLVMQFHNNPDYTFTLKNWKTESSRINWFEFYDGTIFRTEEFLNSLGTSRPDIIKWHEFGLNIFTREGRDKIYLGPFQHYIDAGPGNDHIEVSPGGYGIFKGGEGDDTINIKSSADSPYECEVYGGPGEDTIAGGDGYDVFYGGRDNDKLLGGGGTDILVGDDGEDTLSGDAGADVLEGGKHDDILLGGEGDDILIGGLHNDTMAGGDGNDTYVYELGDGDDSIIDIPLTAAPSVDTLVFGLGITKENTKVYLQGTDLFIIAPDGGQVAIKDYTNPKNTIEEIIFEDKSHISSSDINSIIQSMAAYGEENRIELSRIDYGKASDDLTSSIAFNFQESA